jgi:hypothetical protein
MGLPVALPAVLVQTATPVTLEATLAIEGTSEVLADDLEVEAAGEMIAAIESGNLNATTEAQGMTGCSHFVTTAVVIGIDGSEMRASEAADHRRHRVEDAHQIIATANLAEMSHQAKM